MQSYNTMSGQANERCRLLQCLHTLCCIYANRKTSVAIRIAQLADLPAIVDIYNASIPGRMATADTTPVTVADRVGWFAEFDPRRRPLWVFCNAAEAPIGWLSIRSFYGRPAYHATAEVGAYVAPEARGQGVARQLLDHALHHAPALGLRTLLAFVFAHNAPSLVLFGNGGFTQWGLLPRVAELDGVERDLAIFGRRLP